MSGIINKVKEALHHDKTDTTSNTTGTHTSGVTGNHNTSSALAGSTNHGPHDSNLTNKADPRIDSDRDGRAGGLTGNNHSSGLTGNNHSSGLTGNTHGTGVGSNTHSSGLTGTGVGSNTHSSGLTGNTHGTGVGSNTHSSGLTGNTGTGIGSNTTHSSSTTAGPHSSNLANKADPRVDSDLSNSGYGSSNTHNTGLGSSNTHSSGLTGNTHGTGVGSNTHSTGLGSSTHGITGTSGYSGTHAGNHTTGTTGTHGGISNSTNAGPHESNLANKADPRVDSDLDGKGNRHGANTGGVFGASGSHATAGSGTAQNTAGPHNSDMANKLDPRVDSDRDGSKTYMGNATHK